MSALLPGPALHAAVRAALIAQRTSLRKWCIEHNATPQWARQVLLGYRTGAAADEFLKRISQAANVDSSSAAAMSANFHAAMMRLKEQLGVERDRQVAAYLRMTPTALFERKRRGTFPVDKLRAAAQQQPDRPIDVDYVLAALEPAQNQHTTTTLDSDTLALANELSSISRQASRLGRELRDATLATLAAQLDAITAEQRRMNERLARIEAALLPLAGRQS